MLHRCKIITEYCLAALMPVHTVHQIHHHNPTHPNVSKPKSQLVRSKMEVEMTSRRNQEDNSALHIEDSNYMHVLNIKSRLTKKIHRK